MAALYFILILNIILIITTILLFIYCFQSTPVTVWGVGTYRRARVLSDWDDVKGGITEGGPAGLGRGAAIYQGGVWPPVL